MELPAALRDAIDGLAARIPARALAERAAALSSDYRELDGGATTRLVPDPETAAAYAVVRMPATFAAVAAAMDMVAEALPDWSPDSLLDAGAGPGTAAWAAAERWPGISRMTLCEPEPHMAATGRELASHASVPGLSGAQWRTDDVRRIEPMEPFSLVVSSYMLGELSEEDAAAAVDRLWVMTRDVLLLVEPGTPERFGRMRRLRDRLVQRSDTHLISPCPHEGDCPMRDGDWCHFSQRIARSGLHRQLKAAELGYEDEKYCCLALARQPGVPCGARVLRHPFRGKKLIRLDLCTPQGYVVRTVTKGKNPDFYRTARDLAWGDAVENLPER